jgi:glycogen(starch) synthase
MRLILYSPFFHPRLGGLETVVQVLATEWVKLGHQVTVITETPHDKTNTFIFDVLRQPSLSQKIQSYRQANAVILANISLWGLLPLLFCGFRRPVWIATHHGWYENPGHPLKLLDRFKKRLAPYASANISVSRAVDRFLELNACVIPNPYNHRLFRHLPDVTRTRDLVFLGRLVSDKGCELLLDSLAQLRNQGQTPSLTIIGSGPEKESLENQVRHLNLQTQVHFTGPQSGEALVHLLNQHRIMVVPSRWNEPFGIVALEGIACGCAVIGSNGGGLAEAIGPCGATFPNDNAQALTALLHQAFTGSLQAWTDPVITQLHLARHEAPRIAQAYLDVIQNFLPQRKVANTQSANYASGKKAGTP